MKKVVILELILLALLVVLVGGTWLSMTTPWVPEEAAATAPPTEPTELVTEPPTEPEPETQPPTAPEPTEPPYVIETQSSWSDVLYDWDISAGEYFVYDLDAEKFLLRTGSPEETVYPASITKLYTAYVALQYIAPEELVTVGNEIHLVDVDSSVAELEMGDVLTAEKLVAGMLLPSGNDATYALAVTVGRLLAQDPELDAYGALDRFVEQMNTDAQALGLTGSHFATVDGIHSDDHYISMQDMVTIGKLALGNEVIAGYVSEAQHSLLVAQDRELVWENSNYLLHEDSRYYCDYITGLKTGFTTPAGYCLLSSVNVDGRDLLIGVFECPFPNDRFADTLLLFMRTFNLPVTAP